MLEALSAEAVGAIVVAAVAIVLWKVLKLAVKVVVFVVVIGVVAVVVGAYVKHGRSALPLPEETRDVAGGQPRPQAPSELR